MQHNRREIYDNGYKAGYNAGFDEGFGMNQISKLKETIADLERQLEQKTKQYDFLVRENQTKKYLDWKEITGGAEEMLNLILKENEISDDVNARIKLALLTLNERNIPGYNSIPKQVLKGWQKLSDVERNI